MREPVKLRVFYFLLYSAIASWMAFFNVHLEGLGFSGFQIGAVNAVYISTSIIVVPLGGMMSDRYGANRVLLILTLLSGMLIYLAGYMHTFLPVIVVMLMLSLFQSPVGTVMDGMTLGYIQNTGKSSYGKFRLWASAGYAIGSVLSGYFAAINSSNIFLLAAIFFGVITIINLITLPPKPLTGRGLVNFKSFGVFFKNRQVFIFFILIFLFGISISPLHHFINLYYTEIGASDSQIGIAFAVQAGLEIPFFLYGVRYVKRVGTKRIIMLAMIVSVLRMLLYGMTGNPWIAIGIGSLHGFTISFFLIGVVEYVQKQTPPHLRATGQSLIMTFHFGAGLTLGNLWIGYLKDAIGMQQVMLVQAAFATIIVTIVAMFFAKER